MKDMEEIEEIIRQNRDFFDDSEPKSGHFERFTVKLEGQNRNERRNRYSVSHILKAAAVIILIGLSSLWITERFSGDQDPSDRKLSLGDISPEYREAEIYYTSLINTEYTKLNDITQYDLDEKKMMMTELTEMDSLYVQLQEELSANPYDERIINAMIKYYRLKSEILNRIINKLNSINTLKRENHEKIEV